MNYRVVLKAISKILIIEAVLMLIPLGISFFDGNYLSFLITIGLLLLVGVPLSFIKSKKENFYAREGLYSLVYLGFYLVYLDVYHLLFLKKFHLLSMLSLKLYLDLLLLVQVFYQMLKVCLRVYCSGEVLPIGLVEWESLSLF
jgi:hypothetical protein